MRRRSLQVLLVGLDHLLDHLAADRAGLAAGQVAVVAFLQIDADLPWCPRSRLSGGSVVILDKTVLFVLDNCAIF